MEDVAVVLSEQWQQLRRPVATPPTHTHNAQTPHHTVPRAVASLINLAFRFNRTAAMNGWRRGSGRHS